MERMSQDQDTKARPTQIRNGETCTDLDVGNLLQIKRWPKWVLELARENGNLLPFDLKWWDGQGHEFEVNGEQFYTVSRYGLDTSATIALVADSAEYDFRFQVLPHHDDGEQIEILIWKE